jgi:hypothetical protein
MSALRRAPKADIRPGGIDVRLGPCVRPVLALAHKMVGDEDLVAMRI